MPATPDKFIVAAVQKAPVFLDRDATIEKACEAILEAGRQGARLVAFPESYVPTYPDWVWAIPPGEEGLLNQLYAAFLANSVTVPSPATQRLGQAARQAGAYVVIGVSERNAEASGGTLYNSLLYFDDRGNLLGKHRKLVPTGGERLVWGQGDGSTLAAYDTALGKVSGLICWENYMPLARYALCAWGTQIYVAATWDRGDTWQATLRHIAKEGRFYVIGCGMPLRLSDISDAYGLKERYYASAPEWINEGGSAIVGPDGDYVAGPLRMEEGILCAEVDLGRVSGSKWMLDVAGHYARPDVFEVIIHAEPRPMLHQRPGAAG